MTLKRFIFLSVTVYYSACFWPSTVDQCPLCCDQRCGVRHHCYCSEARVPVALERQHQQERHLGLDRQLLPPGTVATSSLSLTLTEPNLTLEEKV